MNGQVSHPAGLREIYRQPSELVANKTAPMIDAESARFLAMSPLCVLATHGPGGTDASPRGGPPGFARVPKAAVVVDVDECFVHCAKALLRANIWDTSTWPDADVPSLGDIITCQHDLQAEPAVIDKNLETGYEATLWSDAG